MTEMYAQVFRELLGPNRARNIYELHSKKSQMQRTRISDRFRSARPGSVLFTSDVSARGVDYPGVTLVLQVGLPSSREQYIHRLGRTGRAGKDGEGVIVLAPFEESFIRKEVSDLPIVKEDAQGLLADGNDAREVIHEAAANLPEGVVQDAYMSFLGYYSARMPLLNQPRSETLVQAEHFIRGFGVTETPHLSPNLLAKMGLNQRSGDRSSFSRSRSPRSDSFRRDDRPRYDRTDDRRRSDSFSRDDKPRYRSFDRNDDRPRRPRFNADDQRPSRSTFDSQGDNHFSRKPKSNFHSDFDKSSDKRFNRD